jgi:two-component system, chemotaxis family, protein-glutamate methylesterase/glutaminase
MARSIRVLVAEDSPTARALLVHMLESDPDVRVVGEAASGREAVARAGELRPDLITMDVHMPDGDGLQATRAIMATIPTPIIVVSALAAADVKLSLEATRAGALLVLPKPDGPSTPNFDSQRHQLLMMVKAMAQVKVVRRWDGPTPRTSRIATPPPMATIPGGRDVDRTRRPRLIAIGASTGGPAALRDILAALPARFPVPILIVQHIAHGFVNGLAQWLGGETPLRVQVATDGQVVSPGNVVIASEDRHLGITKTGNIIRAVLSNEPPSGAFRPSATNLFRSAGQTLGVELVAVILTGMGDDGVAGLHTVHDRGGRVIAQDEASSVIYGMPREALNAGVVDEVLALNAIAARLTSLVGTGATA